MRGRFASDPTVMLPFPPPSRSRSHEDTRMRAALMLMVMADLPGPDLRVEPTIDLGKLSWPQAQQLDGKRVRVSFVAENNGRASRFFPEPVGAKDGETVRSVTYADTAYPPFHEPGK